MTDFDPRRQIDLQPDSDLTPEGIRDALAERELQLLVDDED
jgi:hypothetical protein